MSRVMHNPLHEYLSDTEITTNDKARTELPYSAGGPSTAKPVRHPTELSVMCLTEYSYTADTHLWNNPSASVNSPSKNFNEARLFRACRISSIPLKAVLRHCERKPKYSRLARGCYVLHQRLRRKYWLCVESRCLNNCICCQYNQEAHICLLSTQPSCGKRHLSQNALLRQI